MSDSEDEDFDLEFDDNHIYLEKSKELYTIYYPEEVANLMLKIIDELKDVLKIPAVYARLLLNHFKWDKEKLLECYFDSSTEKFFEDTKIGEPPAPNLVKVKEDCMMECQVCFMEYFPIEMSNMGCGHWYCNYCWDGHLNARITDEAGSDSIFCIEPSCKVLVDDSVVQQLLSNVKTWNIYQKLITNSFVEWNKKFRWCPGPNCLFAVKLMSIHFAPRPVICSCKHSFCFECGAKSHNPTQCSLLKKWLEQDLQTFNWISMNTKECIRCHTHIEKNGGCNHMTCYKCKKEFCWLCLDTWTSHHACNRYQDQENIPTSSSNILSQKRYKHYFARYKTHQESAKLEAALFDMTQHKAEKIKESCDFTENQTIFLKKAVDVLCECRSVLMNSYVFAYFVDKSNNTYIFEDNQNDLEAAIERLSGYLEQELALKNVTDLRQKLMDCYIYCDDRRQVLLNHIYDGYERNWWQFSSAQ